MNIEGDKISNSDIKRQIQSIANIDAMNKQARSLKMTCMFCGSDKCYDLIFSEETNEMRILYGMRGSKFVCMRCLKDTTAVENLVAKFLMVYIRIKRKVGL